MKSMRQGWLRSLKRFILWDYPRGSRAYDVMVALILAFIFLTPRDFFRDQPKASNVVMLPGENGSSVFWIELPRGGTPGQSRGSHQGPVERQTAHPAPAGADF